MNCLLVPKREYFIIPVYIKDSDLCIYAFLREAPSNITIKATAEHFRRSKHFIRDSVNRLIRAGFISKKGTSYIIHALTECEVM